MADWIKAIGAAVAGLITAAIAVWWLTLVSFRLNTEAETDENGAVVLDEYQRSKDILLVVLPLFSASLAFWVGTQGTVAAKEEAEREKAKTQAVLDVSDPGVLEQAKVKHPDAFK